MDTQIMPHEIQEESRDNGFINSDMDAAMKKLEELLSQNQFELLLPVEEGTIRLVYMMNDAAESFLLFRNARMTGNYRKDYEGALDAVLSREGDQFVLVVYQGKQAVTLFFKNLECETHLYNYGEIGHFWMKGNENLRLLEYQIAILADKCTYLGPDAADEEERALACLIGFPPLNACCFPAVSRNYYVPEPEMWIPSGNAITYMEKIALEKDDRRLLQILRIYRRFPTKWMSKMIASSLCRPSHAMTIEAVRERIVHASSKYANRSFGADTDRRCAELYRFVEKRKKELEKSGIHAEILREEPFTIAQDTIDYRLYLMIYQDGIFRRRIRIEEFPLNSDIGTERHRKEGDELK